jgi:hypothetical protein
MSAFTNTTALAVAIIGLIVVSVQAYSKWLELQTARINKELAKSKNEASDKQIESQSQSRSESPGKTSGPWLRRYFWREQKSGIAFLLVFFFGPPVWATVLFGNNPLPMFVWGVSIMSPMCYILGYITLKQAGEAYRAYKMAEIEDTPTS